MLKKSFYLVLLFPIIGFAGTCQSPWERVPGPMAKVVTCRLSVPHGWMVYHMTTEEMEIPPVFFILMNNMNGFYKFSRKIFFNPNNGFRSLKRL